jgi:hypothetical protein
VGIRVRNDPALEDGDSSAKLTISVITLLCLEIKWRYLHLPSKAALCQLIDKVDGPPLLNLQHTLVLP